MEEFINKTLPAHVLIALLGVFVATLGIIVTIVITAWKKSNADAEERGIVRSRMDAFEAALKKHYEEDEKSQSALAAILDRMDRRDTRMEKQITRNGERISEMHGKIMSVQG